MEHEHDQDCNCGPITLALDDGTNLTCDVLGNFNVNERSYVALVPQGDEEVMILRCDGDEISIIESDEEFEDVSRVFYELYNADDDFDDDDFDEDYNLDYDDDDEDYDYDYDDDDDYDDADDDADIFFDGDDEDDEDYV